MKKYFLLFAAFLHSCNAEIGDRALGNGFFYVKEKGYTGILFCEDENIDGNCFSVVNKHHDIVSVSYNIDFIIVESLHESFEKKSKSYWLIDKRIPISHKDFPSDTLGKENYIKSVIINATDSVYFFNELRYRDIDLKFEN